MSFIKLYVHAVWGTRHRYPLLDEHGRNTLCRHIRYHARTYNIAVLNINGQADHLHALLRIHSTTSVAALIKMIKGESSQWANKKQLFDRRLFWARGYYARTVDENNLSVVDAYISHQNTELTYQHEIVSFLDYLPVEGF